MNGAHFLQLPVSHPNRASQCRMRISQVDGPQQAAENGQTKALLAAPEESDCRRSRFRLPSVVSRMLASSTPYLV